MCFCPRWQASRLFLTSVAFGKRPELSEAGGWAGWVSLQVGLIEQLGSAAEAKAQGRVVERRLVKVRRRLFAPSIRCRPLGISWLQRALPPPGSKLVWGCCGSGSR